MKKCLCEVVEGARQLVGGRVELASAWTRTHRGAKIEIVPGAQHLGVWNRDRAGFEWRVPHS